MSTQPTACLRSPSNPADNTAHRAHNDSSTVSCHEATTFQEAVSDYDLPRSNRRRHTSKPSHDLPRSSPSPRPSKKLAPREAVPNNPSLPPMAPRGQINQPLSTSGPSSSRPPRTRLSSRTRQPTPLHVEAVIQLSTKNTTVEQNPTTNPSLPPTAPPSNHSAPAKLNFYWGYRCTPGVSSSPK